MEQPYERWEYLTDVLYADAEKQQAYLEQHWPGRTFLPYTPKRLCGKASGLGLC